MSPTRTFAENAAYAGISLFFRVLGLLPAPAAAGAAEWIGRIWFAADPRHRRIAVANLTQAFGHDRSAGEIRTLARKVFKQLARVLFEIGWYQSLDLKKDRCHFSLEGLGHLKNARERQKGLLILTAHMGNWELLPAAAAMHGVAMHVVYRPLDAKPLERFFANSRTRFGARLIPTARSMRRILTTLQQGGGVAMLMDQNFDCHEGVFADFFGKPACTNKGMALLARKTGAPVVPVFLVRRPGGFKVIIRQEIPFVRTGDKTKDLEVNTLRYNQAIEAVIRRYPDQWFWVHQRYKTRTCHPWPRQPGP